MAEGAGGGRSKAQKCRSDRNKCLGGVKEGRAGWESAQLGQTPGWRTSSTFSLPDPGRGRSWCWIGWGVHRKPEVREAIEARGCESVLLPGYGPDFNPSELAFSKIEGFVKAVGARTRGRWTLRSRLRWGRCRWGMWWVGLSMPESRITHCENRCKRPRIQLGRSSGGFAVERLLTAIIAYLRAT